MPIRAFELASNSAHILVLCHILIMFVLELPYMSPVVLFGLLAVFLLIIIQIQVGFVILCPPTSSLGLWLLFMRQADYIFNILCLFYYYYNTVHNLVSAHVCISLCLKLLYLLV